ncbi:MAG: flagellar hook protein FlgE [Bryobacteraceae bacterium]|nr:flagellar hook protein FlgE [Bryobacteraceae bacterium]
MSFNSFSSALSALKAHSAAVDTVGHNLANVNTTGYKSVDVAFKDVVAQSVNSKGESGLGVGRVSTVRNFNQGAIQTSSGALDSAIQGSGFFVVNDGLGTKLLTRDGTFQLDKAGYVVTLTGERVQQYGPSGLADIQVPTGTSQASPTDALSIVANLNASAPIGEVFSTPVEVMDTLGVRHTLTFSFTKTAANSWDYDVTIPAADQAPVTALTLPASKTLTFDSSGKLTSPAAAAPIAIGITNLANEAADLSITWSLYDAKGQASISQFSQPSAPSRTDVNGFAAAEVTALGMADGGRVMARYGNGQEKEIAKLAIALVGNPSTLTSVSDNNFRPSGDTAAPVYGVAETGGRGKIKAGALEGSTVDIAKEFTNLIVYQRGYQANSRVITTTDEISQETLNLKR